MWKRERIRAGCALLPVALAVAVLLIAAPALAARKDGREELVIPRISQAPVMEDFLSMAPVSDTARQMALVSQFVQQQPSDGQPPSQRTDVYLGYDDKNLYVVFVAHDTEPEKIRARMVPRENIFGDDIVEILLDTFHDERRAYVFLANPYGIQMDALWTEGGQGFGGGGGRGGGGVRLFDSSFDTLWYSRGALTEQGYVVLMAIPFKSLRFPAADSQRWGIVLHRSIERTDERVFWPHISTRIEGRMNQAADMVGLENISPGRNIQLIPYGTFNSFRALDNRDENFPRFVTEGGEVDGGLDAKFVFLDSLVLDVAINPDFSQVESDQPRVTTNQRFEVFFPERRPFFLENSSFFGTPINLLFTRRIADPQFGVRLSGKTGPYAIGALFMDDQSPGRSVTPDDPDFDKRAWFGAYRINRDIFGQSSIGTVFTQREFDGSYNRVGGVDGRLKFNSNWAATFQAVTSKTVDEDDGELVTEAGPAYKASLQREGRTLEYSLNYDDVGRGFRTLSGFVRRRDIRRINQRVQYNFRPENRYLISWGPRLSTERVYDHTGLRLDYTQDAIVSWQFRRQSRLSVFYNFDRERLRPDDFSVLADNVDFQRNRKGFSFGSSYFSKVSVRGRYSWGTRINFRPPDCDPLNPPLPGDPACGIPVLADLTSGNLNVTVRPITPLRIDNDYILSRLTSREVDAGIFTNNIARSRWNWQFNRELSLRAIFEYQSLLANPRTSDLATRKNFNADFLLTYLLNPGTALFIGYNTNLQNIHLTPGIDDETGEDIIEVVGRRSRYINDARGFFVKFSYLFRF